MIILACLGTACGKSPDAAQQTGQTLPAASPALPSEVDSRTAESAQFPPERMEMDKSLESPPVRAGLPSIIAMPPADTETPPLAANAEVTYVCESGLPVVVTFQGARATVTLPDGREFMLTQAAGVEGGREEYRGRGATLVRAANVVELSLHSEGSTMRCAESSATA